MSESEKRFAVQYRTPHGTYEIEASHGFVLPLLVRLAVEVVLHRLRHLVEGDGYRD